MRENADQNNSECEHFSRSANLMTFQKMRKKIFQKKNKLDRLSEDSEESIQEESQNQCSGCEGNVKYKTWETYNYSAAGNSS